MQRSKFYHYHKHLSQIFHKIYQTLKQSALQRLLNSGNKKEVYKQTEFELYYFWILELEWKNFQDMSPNKSHYESHKTSHLTFLSSANIYPRCNHTNYSYQCLFYHSKGKNFEGRTIKVLNHWKPINSSLLYSKNIFYQLFIQFSNNFDRHSDSVKHMSYFQNQSLV